LPRLEKAARSTVSFDVEPLVLHAGLDVRHHQGELKLRRKQGFGDETGAAKRGPSPGWVAIRGEEGLNSTKEHGGKAGGQ